MRLLYSPLCHGIQNIVFYHGYTNTVRFIGTNLVLVTLAVLVMPNANAHTASLNSIHHSDKHSNLTTPENFQEPQTPLLDSSSFQTNIPTSLAQVNSSSISAPSINMASNPPFNNATTDNLSPDSEILPSMQHKTSLQTSLSTANFTNNPSEDAGETDNLVDNIQSNLSQSFQNSTVQQSLERLAKFYQLNQTDIQYPASINVNQEDATVSSSSTQPIEAATETYLSYMPNKSPKNNKHVINANSLSPLAPNILYADTNYSKAPRCEGVWVSPAIGSNYQKALNQMPIKINSNDPIQPPVYTQADYGYYDNDKFVELIGDVEVMQGSQIVAADKFTLDLKSGLSGAQGQVMFADAATQQPTPMDDATRYAHKPYNDSQELELRDGLIGVANQLAYNSHTGLSTAYDVAFASVPLQAHGYATKVNKSSQNRYEMDSVMLTTCPPTDRKWQIEAQKIDLDTQTGRGEAFDTTFLVKGVPIFYLPYFNFPIDSRRASGFLVPTAGIDSENGLQLNIPYYVNIAPNYDLTVNTQLFSKRNPMLTGEFRYLSQFGEGGIVASYLANDKLYDDKDRTGLFYRHHWVSDDIDHLTADATYNYVSDAAFLNDFDSFGIANNDLNLPRSAQINYYNDYLDGQLKIETFQTLDAKDAAGNPILDKDKPYSRLPQLSVNYRLPWFKTFTVEGVHDSAYFKKSIDDNSTSEKSGIRFYNSLSASLPISRTWGYITPEATLQHLFSAYDETSRINNNLSHDDSSQGVFVPQLSVDAGLNFYQAGSPFNWFDDTMGGYQLLSPRLKYIYSPYKNQKNIPNFNTRVASINYEQLFQDSWLLGYDRLPDNHAITPGVNYSYIDALGVTRFDASIGQQFFLDSSEVTLDKNQPIFTENSSGIVWSTSARPYRNIWFDLNGALKSNSDINFVTTQLRYQPTEYSLFNIGFIKRNRSVNAEQLPLSAWTASTLFPINDRIRLMAQGQYDVKLNIPIEALIGIDYQDCCYGFSVYGRRYYNDLDLTQKPNQAIMFELRINGLGGKRSNRLSKLLAQKALGFDTAEENWRF